MLQQTTVGTVTGRYERFLERFPDVASLARAREESVLAAWSGLGYYARARNLWRAARRIAAEHGGRLPRQAAQLAELPGFGRYMAAAVACFAFGRRVPAAEANIRRVVSRLSALEGSPVERERAVLDRVLALLPRRRPGDGLAALMDLGQLVCTPRAPRCTECPLASDCAALALGAPEGFPARQARGGATVVYLAAALAQRDDRLLVERRPGGYLAGLWAFPSAEAPTARQARHRLKRLLEARSMCLLSDEPVARAVHTIMRRRLRIEIFRALAGRGPISEKQSRWLARNGFERAATPTLTRKIARAAGFIPSPGA